MAKKKVYSNLGADGKPVEIAKKTRKTKTDNPVAKAIKEKKKASVKPRLSETPTFLDIVTVNPKHYAGFTYRLTLTHRLAPGAVMYYLGKKGFDTGTDWRYYQSSSEKVMQKLNDGWTISYEVLNYYRASWELGAAETKLIAQSWHTEALRDKSLNFGIPCGANKSMSRYQWCKRYLNQVDKRY